MVTLLETLTKAYRNAASSGLGGARCDGDWDNRIR